MPRTDADRHVPYYPAFLDLVRKRVVVVGGGELAARKVAGLLPCAPAALVVIAPAVNAALQEAASRGAVAWLARAYAPGDLAGADIAFAATDDPDTNAAVAREARQRGVPVLAIDDIPNCDFIAPAIVQRGDLVIAISTGGRSPAMARRTRVWLEAALPAHWGALLDVAARVRTRLGPVRRQVSPEQWQAALDPAVEGLVQAGASDQAAALLEQRLRGGSAP